MYQEQQSTCTRYLNWIPIEVVFVILWCKPIHMCYWNETKNTKLMLEMKGWWSWNWYNKINSIGISPMNPLFELQWWSHLRRLPTINRVCCRWILLPVTLLTCICSLMHQMGIPRNVVITVSSVMYEVQHYTYDRSASFCSYIKQHAAFIYRCICKIKYC